MPSDIQTRSLERTREQALREQMASLTGERRELLARLLADKGIQMDQPLILPVPRRGEPIPAGIAQARLWFLEQLSPGNPAYHMVTAFRLRGSLDLVALQESLDSVLDRHEILRTGFPSLEGVPVQVIGSHARMALPLEDLADRSPVEQRKAAEELLEELVARPFELERPPLARAMLLKLGQEDHLFYFSVHHLVFDGWSIALMLKEVQAFYDARVAGKDPALHPLPIQFADYAHWQRARLDRAEVKADLAYWREKLKGPLQRLELPQAKPLPAIATNRGGWCPLDLDPGLARDLGNLAREEGTTLYVVLLAAFKAALQRWTLSEDLPIGIPVSGRTHKECEPLIGFLVNTLVCRSRLQGCMSFREAIHQVRQTLLEALDHQEVPFDQVVDHLRPERQPGGNPLFQIAMALHEAPPLPALQGLTLTRLDVPWRWSRFELTLMLERNGNQLAGGLEFSTDRYDSELVSRFARDLVSILGRVARAPWTRLESLPVNLPPQSIPSSGLESFPPAPASAPVPATRVERSPEVREEVIRIWKSVLQVEEVGLDDNFFDLGGHSLRMGKVKDEIKARFGIEVPIVRLFANPTVRSLSGFISEAGQDRTAVLEGKAIADKRMTARARAARRPRPRTDCPEGADGPHG